MDFGVQNLAQNSSAPLIWNLPFLSLALGANAHKSLMQDSLSGITWHCINDKIDCGEIIIQKSIPLNSTHTYLTLTQQQLELGFAAFIEVCDSLLRWNLDTKAQDFSCASNFHKAKDLCPIRDTWI